jgi:glycosyltransferase involved in cell wall biosynthesis
MEDHNHHNCATPLSVAVVVDEIACLGELDHVLTQLRDRGVPGAAIEVIGTTAGCAHRLRAVAEVELPFAPGVRVPVPGITEIVAALSRRPYDVVHICTPGPTGTAALLGACAIGAPVIATFHTELVQQVTTPRPDPHGRNALELLASFYRQCTLVLSPGPDSDRALELLGIEAERVHRLAPSVDLDRLSPARYRPEAIPLPPGTHPQAVHVLYVGELTTDPSADLLVEAFALARDRDRRLQLIVAGPGERDALPELYASTDLLVHSGGEPATMRAILEAQASGLPVLAVYREGCADLIENGRSGCLVAPSVPALAEAIAALARRSTLLERLATGGLMAVRSRTWEALGSQLVAIWASALAGAETRSGTVARAA